MGRLSEVFRSSTEQLEYKLQIDILEHTARSVSTHMPLRWILGYGLGWQAPGPLCPLGSWEGDPTALQSPAGAGNGPVGPAHIWERPCFCGVGYKLDKKQPCLPLRVCPLPPP